MKKIASIIGLAATLLFGAASAPAAINAIDNVPAATLLLPYFDVDPANPGASRTVLTVGNRSAGETLANVVLWTDRGVPTYRFNVRLPANGVAEIDLGELFAGGTLPQSTAGGFGTCAASLPPAPLDAATLAGLRNAHSGQASALLGGQCGSSPLGDAHARGYATIDVVGTCAAAVPGNAGYFVAGGNGVALNANVLWGEQSTYNASTGTAYGDALVHIEADGANASTTGASYTFYARRNGGSSADNREKLPTKWMGRYSLQDTIFRTQAQVWRDPGQVAPFACGAPPAGLSQYEVYAFDHQEQISVAGQGSNFPLAAQSVDLGNPAQARVPYTLGFIYYNLDLATAAAPFALDSQAHVSHVYAALSGDSGKSTTWATGAQFALDVPLQLCADGIDNDGDGLIDYPNDPGCAGPTDTTEASVCSDGIDNDGDGLVDFPADPGCGSPAWDIENPECNDGVDNDGDTLIDFPNDPGCSTAHDRIEGFTPVCDDGLDNDNDGLIDYPADPGCLSLTYPRENNGQCDDGVDNDGDGLIDFPADSDCTSATDPVEAPPQCRDGIDNDGDGLIDFPADLGCASADDPSETAPVCSDGVDNDGDGLIDFPNDPGCANAASNNEAPQCNDGTDNDGDGLIDYPNDPGCAAASSTNERPQCNDGVDNDGDGLIDFPNDPGCPAASANNEATPQCSDGIDNDGNGFIDFPLDPNCTSAGDEFEAPACSDTADNDGDGAIDYPADLGCDSAADQTEFSGGTAPQCADGIDNDGDGAVDYPADTGCTSAGDDVEFAQAGGGGVTIVLTPATLPNGTVSTMYPAQAIVASGGLSPYTFAVTGGALPTGLVLDAAGTLTGTPTANGAFAFTVTATDLNGFTGTRDYVITIVLRAVATPVPLTSPAVLALLLLALALAAGFALRRRAA